MSHDWKYQQAHYDRHARPNIDTQEALRQREEGPALPLKRFHNTIKRELIRRFAYQKDSLLDYACGRGGDLYKWKDAMIGYVRGIDLSPVEIQEAQRRYEELMRKDPGCPFTVEFFATEKLGQQECKEDMEFDVVTCMFAIHYFAVTEPAMKNILRNVSINLKEGGYFIGTVPDGKRVLLNLNNQPTYRSPMLKLTQRWRGMPQTFGCAYSCDIADTVTSGHGESRGSYEFLVFFTAFKAIAASFDLYPVIDYQAPTLEANFEEEDAKEVFKHFRPSFPDSDPSLEKASALNTAFVFQKLPPNTPVYLPPLPEPSRPDRHKGGDGFRGQGRGGKRRGSSPRSWGGNDRQTEGPPYKRQEWGDPHCPQDYGRGSRQGGRGEAWGTGGRGGGRHRYNDLEGQSRGWGAGPHERGHRPPGNWSAPAGGRGDGGLAGQSGWGQGPPPTTYGPPEPLPLLPKYSEGASEPGGEPHWDGEETAGQSGGDSGCRREEAEGYREESDGDNQEVDHDGEEQLSQDDHQELGSGHEDDGGAREEI